MPKYYGCPCEGCGRPLALTDDIVVCPDCGAPYHRECYEKLGRCIHTPAHGAGYEWTFPYKDDALRTCPSCGERTLRTEERCRCCGSGHWLSGGRTAPTQTDALITTTFTASISRRWRNPPAATCRRPLARKS